MHYNFPHCIAFELKIIIDKHISNFLELNNLKNEEVTFSKQIVSKRFDKINPLVMSKLQLVHKLLKQIHNFFAQLHNL